MFDLKLGQTVHFTSDLSWVQGPWLVSEVRHNTETRLEFVVQNDNWTATYLAWKPAHCSTWEIRDCVLYLQAPREHLDPNQARELIDTLLDSEGVGVQSIWFGTVQFEPEQYILNA